MREKRGLFQTIFGGRKDDNKGYSAYKLLSSWESTFVPYSGNAWDINTVRSAVDAFARRVSTAQPRHVRTDAETTVSVNDYLDRVLQFKPNPYMTASEFYYKLAAQYKIYNNAIAYLFRRAEPRRRKATGQEYRRGRLRRYHGGYWDGLLLGDFRLADGRQSPMVRLVRPW